MNHPTREDWMSFLYGEDSSEYHSAFDRHLRGCAECADKVNSWRVGAKALDEWRLPAAPGTVHSRRPAWKWAAAALLLGVGVALGRFALPGQPDAQALRASLAHEFDQKLAKARTELAADFRQQQNAAATDLLAKAFDDASAEARRLLSDYAKEQEQQHADDKETLVAALRQLDAKYAASLAVLRNELETVAVNTEDSFLETEQRLGHLASITQPSNLQPK
jgi:hypothetical protein